MANNDFFTEFNNDDLNKLFEMNQFDAFAGMDIPSFESMNSDFNAMEKNMKSEFELPNDSYGFDEAKDSIFDIKVSQDQDLFNFGQNSMPEIKMDNMPDFEDFSKSVEFDFDFGVDFEKAEKEFNQQFKETAKSSAAFEKVFTKEDEAERKRAIKDAVRKEKEKLLEAKKQAKEKIKAEKAAAKAAARKTPEFIQQIREKYYGFIDKIQRCIDDIEGERIEAQTQRYIVAKYKKVEKAKLAAAKKEAAKLEVKEPKVKEPKVKQPKVREPKVKEPKVREPKVQKIDSTGVLQLAKARFDNAYYTWAVVWDQLDEERELRKIDKLSKQHNKEFLQ